AGAFYVQVFQYIDPGIAFGPAVSVEALVGAIVGGMGTLWGPVLGALALHLVADLTRNLFGELPGINMVIYGVVLILIVMFAPRGVAGAGISARRLLGAGERRRGSYAAAGAQPLYRFWRPEGGAGRQPGCAGRVADGAGLAQWGRQDDAVRAAVRLC